jgi:hypothetical protein
VARGLRGEFVINQAGGKTDQSAFYQKANVAQTTANGTTADTRDAYQAPATRQGERDSLAPSSNVGFHGDTKPLLANLRKDAGDFGGDCSHINRFPAPLDLFGQNSLDKR